MKFKKSLKRNSKKNGQALLEYVLLVGIAILAIATFNVLPKLRGYAGENGGPDPSGFEVFFRELARPAGGIVITQ